MPRYVIANPEDYPAPLSVPWDQSAMPRNNCYSYFMNRADIPYGSVGSLNVTSLRSVFDMVRRPLRDLLLTRPENIVDDDSPHEALDQSMGFLDTYFALAVQDGNIPVNRPVTATGFRLGAFVAEMEPLRYGEMPVKGMHWLRLDLDKVTGAGIWTQKNNIKPPEILPEIIFPHEEASLTLGPNQIFLSYFLTPADPERAGQLPDNLSPVTLDQG